jgi:1,4-dihydroxy-2-naphthoyl-CoA hydrolase
MIWFKKDLHINDLHAFNPDTMATHLAMQWVELGPDFLKLKMPVDHRTHQPFGLLHGGASCALAETVGSVASHLVIDPEKFNCVGIEINANHIRGVRATAVPLHLGAGTHVWDIRIYDDAEKLICVSRLTVAVLQKK